MRVRARRSTWVGVAAVVSAMALASCGSGETAEPSSTAQARPSNAELLEFRRVLQDLPPAPTDVDVARVAALRGALEVPDGVTAVQVVNDELAERGQPIIDPSSIGVESTTTDTTTSTVASQQDSVPTTIDPASKNRYGVAVYVNAQGEFDPDLIELLRLEQSAQQASIATTAADDVDAAATVVLEGAPSTISGVTVTHRYQLGPVQVDGSAIESATVDRGGIGGSLWVVKPVFAEGSDGDRRAQRRGFTLRREGRHVSDRATRDPGRWQGDLGADHQRGQLRSGLHRDLWLVQRGRGSRTGGGAQWPMSPVPAPMSVCCDRTAAGP